MNCRIHSEVRGGRRLPQRLWRWLLLLAGALGAMHALAAPAADDAQPGPPADKPANAGWYRVVALADSFGAADLNARNQVAYTNVSDAGSEARFYDGARTWRLGTLGGPNSLVGAVNDRGQVVGQSSLGANGPFRAFLWSRAKGMRDLGVVNGADAAFAADINNKGEVAGQLSFNGGDAAHPFYWSAGTGMLDLGLLEGTSSIAFQINDAGRIMGQASNLDAALSWTASEGLLAIRSPSNLTPVQATDLNERGQISGSFGLRPFLWTPGAGSVDLGGAGGRAFAVNDKGVVAGGNFVTQRAFVWTPAGGQEELGTLGGAYSGPADINNRGQIVGMSAVADGTPHAFIWTRKSGMVDLNTRLRNAPPGLVLSNALEINDGGAVIAGGNTGLVLLLPGAGHAGAPVIGPLQVSGNLRTDTPLSFRAAFTDAGTGASQATWSWGDGSSSAGAVAVQAGTQANAGSAAATHAYRAAGIYTVRLTLTGSDGRRSTVSRKLAVGAGGTQVSGAGALLSPRGAYRADIRHMGMASFALLAPPGAGAGQAQAGRFEFAVANMAFFSTYFTAQSVSGGRIVYRGSGTVNGLGDHGFELAVTAAARAGGLKEGLGLRIWHAGAHGEVVDYDNRAGAE